MKKQLQCCGGTHIVALHTLYKRLTDCLLFLSIAVLEAVPRVLRSRQYVHGWHVPSADRELGSWFGCLDRAFSKYDKRKTNEMHFSK
jgi:hypothetical protein